VRAEAIVRCTARTLRDHRSRFCQLPLDFLAPNRPRRREPAR
jgi:hypothetical protein